VFGKLNALAEMESSSETVRWRFGEATRLSGPAAKEQNMYATKMINGTPAIQLNGKSVLRFGNQNWDFANWLCALLNELGHMPESFFGVDAGEQVNTINGPSRRKVQHA
jgi:hypothetical protein